MEGIQRELRFNTLDELAQQMDNKSRLAIEALRAEPDVMLALQALRSYNQKQANFWDYILKFVEEETTGKYPRSYI